jgi:Na+/H+-dicarboxylate symporter
MLSALKRTSLTHWIIIATIAGAVVGWLDHDVWTQANVGEAL